MSKYTPTPWQSGNHFSIDGIRSGQTISKQIAVVKYGTIPIEEARANKAIIIHRVNNFPILVAALEAVMRQIRPNIDCCEFCDCRDGSHFNWCAYELVRAALAEASK